MTNELHQPSAPHRWPRSSSYLLFAVLLLYGSFVSYGVRLVGLSIGCLLSMATAVFFWRKGSIDAQDLLVVLALYLLYLASGLVGPTLKQWARPLVVVAAGSAMIAAAIVVVGQTARRRTYYPEIASYFANPLKIMRPGEVAFTAPEFPVLEFYTFRSGEYWDTYYFHQSFSTFMDNLTNGARLFYVVDPSGSLYGGRVSPEKLKALQVNAVDVTASVERTIGHRTGLEIFVPRGAEGKQERVEQLPTTTGSSE